MANPVTRYRSGGTGAIAKNEISPCALARLPQYRDACSIMGNAFPNLNWKRRSKQLDIIRREVDGISMLEEVEAMGLEGSVPA